MSKFSKSARSLLAGALLLLPGIVLAQQPAATPGATPAATPKPKFGYLRFWNMLPPSYGTYALVQKGTAPDAPAMMEASPLNYFDTYLPIAPKTYDLSLVKATDRATTLQQFNVVLRTDVYVTILATEVDGKPKFELLDDTYDLTTAYTGKLTIRNFFPDTKVTISSGTLKTRPLAWGESEVLDGFSLGKATIQMKGALKSGRVQEWSADIDFRQMRHATILAVADPYGRFRPRVNLDGPMLGAAAASE